MYCVYVIQNNINLKIYVGKTSRPHKRYTEHLYIAKTGYSLNKSIFSLIHKAIVKYGKENFSFQVIDKFEDEKDCLEAEKFWIEFFRSDVNRFGNEYGYNLTAGGDGLSGRLHSQEEKNKISSSLKGRKFSDEHKDNLSKSHSGKIGRLNFKTKIEWPADKVLLDLYKDNGFTATGKMLGVSNVAVRERLKRRKLI